MAPTGFKRDRPYNELPLLPPKKEVETPRTLKQAIGATRALAELRTVGHLIPNQSMLIRAAVLQEARLSSEIENIVTTNDELYRALSESQAQTDPQTKEVLHYEEALWHGVNRLNKNRPLNATLLTELAQIIKKTTIGVRKSPGCQIANDRTGEVIYTPPEGESRLRDLLDNLSDYLYRHDETDPLIKLAVSHYQFEAIHPFPDGNGRTGRILNILYLMEQGLLEKPVLYLSRFIIEKKDAYYAGLREVTESGAWEDWIVYMLQGIESTADTTREIVLKVRRALDEAVELARKNMNRGYSKELVELVFEQPYTRIPFLETAGIAKRQAASEYLHELVRIGILSSEKKGREVLFRNEKLLGILSPKKGPPPGSLMLMGVGR